MEIFFDIGAHKGKYTDLILKEYNIKKAYLFEPQVKMFNFIKEKYKDKNFINVKVKVCQIKQKVFHSISTNII